MSATALELDPYVLPLPTPGSPVVPDHLVTAVHAHLNARYDAPVWPLAPLTENPSENRASIHWHHCPPAFQDQMRLAAWTMINGELRPTFLKERSGRMRARLSSDKARDTVADWMRLAVWLDRRGISTLASCDAGVLHEYGLHLVASNTNRPKVRRILISLTRLWAFDGLSGRPAGIAWPPWDKTGADDYLPAVTSAGGENTTEAVAEQTMGPLLIWAMRMVDDLADDILAAQAEARRLSQQAHSTPSTADGRNALHAYLKPMISAQDPIPSTRYCRAGLARTYIAAITGASINQVNRLAEDEHLVELAAQRPGPCPLDVPVTGQIAGHPWRQALDFYEAATLMRHLGTACFIVIAYLTGMRPGEVLGLRTGCCPDPEPDASGRSGRHRIYGNVYKDATDEHGNHRSAGVEREVPWVAITPVVNAIRVLERIVPDGHLLFDHTSHDRASRPGTGSLKERAVRLRIDGFATWANAEAAAHGLYAQAIPPDLHGTIGSSRFRRSLAWHIARRPGGLVALAIQYGHLRTTVSEGYASRSRDGIHELIDIETARAVADTVADLNDDLHNGGGLSGPAARRAIKAAATAPRFAGTTITARTARRLIANEDAVLYDNPQALLLCHYKRDRALCHRDQSRDTPSLDRCVPGCGNVVRTDQHAEQLRVRADVLDQRAAHTPGPISDRLRANAVKLRTLADEHDRTRITVQEATE